MRKPTMDLAEQVDVEKNSKKRHSNVILDVFKTYTCK